MSLLFNGDYKTSPMGTNIDIIQCYRLNLGLLLCIATQSHTLMFKSELTQCRYFVVDKTFIDFQ